MVGDTKMQQLVNDHEVLEFCDLLSEIGCKRYRAQYGARTPFSRHPLDANKLRLDFESSGPAFDASPEQFLSGITFCHRQLAQQIGYDPVD
jgi:hypothetical protein